MSKCASSSWHNGRLNSSKRSIGSEHIAMHGAIPNSVPGSAPRPVPRAASRPQTGGWHGSAGRTVRMIHARVYDRYSVSMHTTPTYISHRGVSRWVDVLRKLDRNTIAVGCAAMRSRNTVVLEHARSGMFKHAYISVSCHIICRTARVCVRARVRVRVCARARACVCVCVCV